METISKVTENHRQHYFNQNKIQMDMRDMGEDYIKGDNVKVVTEQNNFIAFTLIILKVKF